MGILGKLFGSSKTEVTPEEMATVAFGAAVMLATDEQRETCAHKLLREAGVEVEHDLRYQAELVAYDLFLIDVIITGTLENEIHQVREFLREMFADFAINSAKSAGITPKPRQEYRRFLECRFSEYHPALKQTMQSQGQAARGAAALSKLAFRRITESDVVNPAALAALNMQQSLIFGEFADVFEQYKVVPDR